MKKKLKGLWPVMSRVLFVFFIFLVLWGKLIKDGSQTIKRRVEGFIHGKRWLSDSPLHVSLPTRLHEAVKLKVSIALPCLTGVFLLILAQEGHGGKEQRLDSGQASVVKSEEISMLTDTGAHRLNLSYQSPARSSPVQESRTNDTRSKSDAPSNHRENNSNDDADSQTDLLIGIGCGGIIAGVIILMFLWWMDSRMCCWSKPPWSKAFWKRLYSQTNVRCAPTGAIERLLKWN